MLQKEEDEREKRRIEEEEARTGVIIHPKPDDALIGRYVFFSPFCFSTPKRQRGEIDDEDDSEHSY